MAAAFRGTSLHSLDDKGRISVPAVFRTALGERSADPIVLTNSICDGARCIEGYALSEWQKFEERLLKKSRFDPQLRKLENYYLARAVECPIDGSGRINVPQHLRSYAGLEREVIFTSFLHGFRIWDRRVWELVFQEAETALLQNPSLFEDVDK